MTVKLILERKGYDVFSTPPETTLGDAITILAKHKIGAIVVCDGNNARRSSPRAPMPYGSRFRKA